MKDIQIDLCRKQNEVNVLREKVEDYEELLRECRFALDELVEKKPGVSGLVCGSTTIGNLKALLHPFKRSN